MRDFLWDGINGNKKFHLVSWEKFPTPISNGRAFEQWG